MSRSSDLYPEANLQGHAHIVRLRKSGPVFQGEMEIDVSENMTIKEFNEIKKDIKKRINEILSTIIPQIPYVLKHWS